MSIGRKLTDKELEKLEKKLAKEYRTAKKEMQKKAFADLEFIFNDLWW